LLSGTAFVSAQAAVVGAPCGAREIRPEIPDKPGGPFVDVTVGDEVENLSLGRFDARVTLESLAAVFVDRPPRGVAAGREALPSQFGARDERERFSYIGHDDALAVVRVPFRTRGAAGEPCLNDILNTITFFHQEDGTWNYRDNHVPGARLLPSV
jgi:hypothetical protein